ncbi:hypothetical protein [Silvibacterium sp.]|uniref:hypothetical protein n=1 Tax=Silvibacterium sp. TaxID=1964179 RepID=UPI0039E63C39
MTVKRWNIAIAGFGGVGRAVARLAHERRERYRTLYHADVRVVAACTSRAGIHNPDGLDPFTLTAEIMTPGLTGTEFLSSIATDVVVDAGPTDFRTGGSSYLYVKASLEAGRHVLAISKGSLVFDYPGLHRLAETHGVQLKVSGATAAALPTIDLLEYNLRGCEVLSLEGILTATANYVLSQMTEGELGLDEAVAQARAAGIAEKDPSFDIGGWDTACKLTILANAGLGASLSIRDLAVRGLEGITAAQIREWKQQCLVPKLVGSLTKSRNEVKGEVGLRLYPEKHAFAQVTGKSKAVRIVTDDMGELIVTGGAGEPRATAAAALKDFEHILMHAR